jgi:ribonucleoside-diphosphate reductase alpha chain
MPAFNITINEDKSNKITSTGKNILSKYLLPNETIQQMYADICSTYADNESHAQRLYEYVSDQWFVFSTPVQSRAPLPISCYLNVLKDNRESITSTFFENYWLSMFGGGIAVDYSPLRSLGSKIGKKGTTSGIIPFLKMQDSATLGISQGNLRRGSTAAYLHVSHPEIEEFISVRAGTGDINRQCLNVHIGVTIPDSFMQAVEAEAALKRSHKEVIPSWDLICPATKEVVKTISALELWKKILKLRVEKSEPYILFIDNINRNRPEYYVKENKFITQSNLCSEIMQLTDENRTGVCCLSHLNLVHYSAWKDNDLFIEDCIRFLDNIISEFIRVGETHVYETPLGVLSPIGKAINGAKQERSLGLGAMGFCSFLQSLRVPVESPAAIGYNKQIFKHIKEKASAATEKLAYEKGPCPDAAKHNVMVRNVNLIAIAPNATSGLIAGVSPSIEPFQANIQLRKLNGGSYEFKNSILMDCLDHKELSPERYQEVINQILTEEGSIQNVKEVFTELEKEVFKTGFELNQEQLVRLNADRVPYVCQSQSFSLFVTCDMPPSRVNKIHMLAWSLGVKSLYYSYPKPVKSKEKISGLNTATLIDNTKSFMLSETNKEKIFVENNWTDKSFENEEGPSECLMCQ